MRRREFLGVLGGAAASWPVVARAQKSIIPVIGFLHSGSPEPNAERVGGFLKGLREAGFVDGRNVAIEYRWASGQYDRLPELAADLVRRNVAVITTLADTAGAHAAKAATTTIPIVFATSGDPVAMGLVASLNRPGGNITGISILNVELISKRLSLLHELVPGVTRISALLNPKNVLGAVILKQLRTGAAALGMQVDIFQASTDAELETAVANVAQQSARALLVGTDPFFFIRRAEIAALAAHYKLPALYDERAYAVSGGLMSYGTNVVQLFEKSAVYVGRVLNGEKPAELPVEQSAKFETVINLKAAKALGIDIPPKLLFTADEVIE